MRYRPASAALRRSVCWVTPLSGGRDCGLRGPSTVRRIQCCDQNGRCARQKLVVPVCPNCAHTAANHDKSVHGIVISTPDHWHTPAAILAMQAGKHVYVEKPCGHDPHEGELIVAAQKKYGKVVEMGTQQRSHDRSIEVIRAVHEGAIGSAYLARAFYANTRGGIGRGKPAPVSRAGRSAWISPPASRRSGAASTSTTTGSSATATPSTTSRTKW